MPRLILLSAALASAPTLGFLNGGWSGLVFGAACVITALTIGFHSGSKPPAV
jgi:hypothetical protein